MRKGIDGLAMLVQGVLRQDPFSGHLFVFRGRTLANLIKIVFWDGTGLCLFRPIALGRKNCLFAGSDGGAVRWAVVASLLATAKLNDVEPFAYLKEVLERMSNGHPMARLDDLLPWNWARLSAPA